MGNIRDYVTINVLANSSSDTIDLTSGNTLYKVLTSGTINMLNNYTIGYTGTPELGTEVEVEYEGRIDNTASSYTVTILGSQIGQGWLSTDFRAVFNWNGSAWIMKVLPNAQLSLNLKIKEYALQASGGTLTLLPGRDESTIVITGAPTLSSNFSVALGGTAVEGDKFDIYWRATPAGLSSFNVSIGGVTLTRGEAFSSNVLVRCYYTGTTWDVHKFTETTNLYSKRFTLTKEISFETGECPGINYILSSGLEPYKIVSIQGYVTKPIAATDSATITLYVNGITTSNVLTAPASSVLDFQMTGGGAISSTVNPGETIELRSAKVTKGGRVCVTLVLEHN